MRDLLRTLADQGRTILVSSHLLSEMELLADDVVIIAAGKLIAQGPLEKVIAEMGDVGQVRVRTPDADKLAAALGSATVVKGDDGSLTIRGVDAAAVGEAALAAGIVLHELTTERPDLERVFLDLTAGKEAIR